MELEQEIPIFPLGSVLYPAGRLALHIFEPRYVAMTEACLRDGTAFGVTLIHAGFEVGTPAVPCEVGCTARIVASDIPEPGRYNLLARGESVFRINRRWTRPDGLIVARVNFLEPPEPAHVADRHAALHTLLHDLIAQHGEDNFPSPLRLDDAAWVGYRLAEMLPVAPERKQKLLEMRAPDAALDAVGRWIEDLGSPR